MTATLTEEIVRTDETDAPEDAAHIVMTPPGEPDETPHAYVMRARIEGFEVVAVCGHRFIPVKNPEPLPVCSPCWDFYQTNGTDLPDRTEKPDA